MSPCMDVKKIIFEKFITYGIIFSCSWIFNIYYSIVIQIQICYHILRASYFSSQYYSVGICFLFVIQHLIGVFFFIAS